MSKISLLSGISATPQQALSCFNPTFVRYKKGETIIDFSDLTHTTKQIGILISGRAHLECMDLDGHCSIIEIYLDNDIFGEVFIDKPENIEYVIVATQPCEICFLDYFKIIEGCENNCPNHAKLLSNLFRIGIDKAEQLALHTSILSRRSIRQKLLTYLKHESKGRASFNIPLKMSELADYLSVDRCAMLREIKNMRDERILTSKGRNFSLL